MPSKELFDELSARTDQLSEAQLIDLKNFFIQLHVSRNQDHTAQAENSIVIGMEQLFAQLDSATVALLKQKIQG